MGETEIKGYGALECIILAIIMCMCQSSCSPYSMTSMEGSVWFREDTYNWELGLKDSLWTPKPIYTSKKGKDSKSMRILGAKKDKVLLYNYKYTEIRIAIP